MTADIFVALTNLFEHNFSRHSCQKARGERTNLRVNIRAECFRAPPPKQLDHTVLLSIEFYIVIKIVVAL